MIYVDTTQPVNIPDTVAKCPECGEYLTVEITEWDTDTGEPTEGGFEISCDMEDFEYDLHAERWPTDWMSVEAKIYQWLLDNVRVAEATVGDLKAWNEAVEDWNRLAA